MEKHKLHFLIVVFLTFLTWHKALGQTFMGEGYFYFNRTFFNDPNIGWSIKDSLLHHDTLARLLFDILPKFFRDDFRLYMLWMLAVVAIVNLLYYFVAYALTKKKSLALMAAIFFGVNYVASFQLLGRGDYHFFAQRIVNLLFVFPSFWLLVRSVEKETSRFPYFISAALYWLAVLSSQHSFFWLPLFVSYPFFFWLERKKNWREFWSKFSLVIPYLLGAFALFWLDKVYGHSLMSNKSLVSVLQNPELMANIAYQFPWVVIPLPILRRLTNPYLREGMIWLALPAAIGGLAMIYYLYRRETQLRAVILTLALFIPTILFLNTYTRPTQVYRISDHSRYLYVPSMAFSILLAILLYSLFRKRKLVGKLLFVGFVSWWIIFNLGLAWAKMDEKQPEHTAAKQTISYIKRNSPQYPEDSLVILHNIMGYYGAKFCEKFYGQGKIRFLPMTAEWKKEISQDFDLERLFALDYDYEQQIVVDKSQEFRELK